jgi:hypothetical protein
MPIVGEYVITFWRQSNELVACQPNQKLIWKPSAGYKQRTSRDLVREPRLGGCRRQAIGFRSPKVNEEVELDREHLGEEVEESTGASFDLKHFPQLRYLLVTFVTLGGDTADFVLYLSCLFLNSLRDDGGYRIGPTRRRLLPGISEPQSSAARKMRLFESSLPEETCDLRTETNSYCRDNDRPSKDTAISKYPICPEADKYDRNDDPKNRPCEDAMSTYGVLGPRSAITPGSRLRFLSLRYGGHRTIVSSTTDVR